MNDPWYTADGIFFEDLSHFWVLEGGIPTDYKYHEWQYHDGKVKYSTRKGLVEYHIKETEDKLAKLNKEVDKCISILNTLRTDESITPYMTPTKKSKREKVGKIII